MSSASATLAKFSADLRYEDIPVQVVEWAKDCLIDTVAACTFGSQMPWSRMVADYATRFGAGGKATLLGLDGTQVQAPFAALANGVFAHAFEQDSVRDPGMGMHAGATIMPALFAMAQDVGADGKTVIRAFVAATEVTSRIAVASQHSPEKLGFHSPGVTGPYGAAIAAGLIMGLGEEELVNALAIAGSLSCGLLAFSKAKQGGMVKRLHPGRAAESGVLAASLASGGFTGPESVLEGRFGFLQAFCGDHPTDPAALTAGLGEVWDTLRISLKRYACHVNAHTSVQSVRELMAEHRLNAAEVEKVVVEAHERLHDRHNILEPADIMHAQYSVPFCVALAIYRNIDDPSSFDETAVNDDQIRQLCRKVDIVTRPVGSVKHTRVIITLKDGRKFDRERTTYKGMPSDPLSRDELRAKFVLLTNAMGEKRAASLFDSLAALEKSSAFSLPVSS